MIMMMMMGMMMRGWGDVDEAGQSKAEKTRENPFRLWVIGKSFSAFLCAFLVGKSHPEPHNGIIPGISGAPKGLEKGRWK